MQTREDGRDNGYSMNAKKKLKVLVVTKYDKNCGAYERTLFCEWRKDCTSLNYWHATCVLQVWY